MTQHETYMSRCLELAQRGKGEAAPNPMVGAVLVYNDRIIGEGWHRKYGQAHAEVNCIDSVRKEDRHLVKESTMYVSLEPCAHYGKTPPCAELLVKEQVKKVVICNADPFEKVSGRGIQILNDNGIPTEVNVLKEEGEWVNRRFFLYHSLKRPYIILKWAQTSDGYFAPLNRTRHQLSNEHSKQLLHKWRTEEAAIMVGYNTALYDDPQLTARLWPGKQPLRIVLDRQLQLPKNLRVFNNDAPTWIVNEQKEGQEGNINYVQITFDSALNKNLLKRLYEADILSLIVEGGAKVLNGFIQDELWDEARVFTAPAQLQEGIASPVLHHAALIATTEIEDDILNVYTHNTNPYTYIPGMEL